MHLKRRSALVSLLVLALALAVAQAPLAHAESAVTLDPTVIDPVGKLSQISAEVSQSSNELSDISKALDQLNDELARVEKEKPTRVTKASLDALQKRFKDTIDRSYVVEKKVTDSLAKSQTDVENVRQALIAIRSERAAGTTRKAVMTDAEIGECLKDLDDLSHTIKALKQSLVDDDDDKPKPAKKPISKGPQKNLKSKTAGSMSRGHISKGK